jgi:protein phosphatase
MNDSNGNRKIRYEVALRSVIGAREEQQDYAYAHTDGAAVFAVVCDGMGGMEGGRIAGLTAAKKLKELYFSKTDEESYPAFFLKSVDILDECVLMLQNDEGKYLCAGTTIVTIAIEDDKLYWLSVGDSRLYILRDNEIVQATRDHNYFLNLDQMVREESITKIRYESEKQKGEALISYIGIGGVQVMDINGEPFLLHPGDIVLLASDGLYGSLPDEEILQCLREGGAERAADALIKPAGNGSRFWDNATFVVVKCFGKEAPS